MQQAISLFCLAGNMADNEEIVSYVLVNWIENNTYSVQNACCVINEKMLRDKSIGGLVKWMEEGVKELKKGWGTYQVHILAFDS